MSGPRNPSTAARSEIEIRRATPDDEDAIVVLAGRALGWRPSDPNAELFRWKHVDNPFGPSPTWVAVLRDELVGVRTFLRWEFEDPAGGVAHAVRAVDTAVHPHHQGHGLFTRLTQQGVGELADSVDFVFNTPNSSSRPGYLKMGWVDVGRVPVVVRPRSLASMGRFVGAKVPATKWSIDTSVGIDAGDALADEDAFASLLASQPASRGLRTRRSVRFLRWRYAAGPIRYRALLRSSDVTDGVALIRLRTRGSAIEATIADVIVPGDDQRLRGAMVSQVLAAGRPDYAISVGRAAVSRAGLRVPTLGPRLTWRALRRRDQPPARGWDLRLGDIELF